VKINIGTDSVMPVSDGSDGPASPLTLEEAVQQAMSKYPAVRVSQEQVSAAARRSSWREPVIFPEPISCASKPRHPQQRLRMLLPSVISPISGPVLVRTR